MYVTPERHRRGASCARQVVRSLFAGRDRLGRCPGIGPHDGGRRCGRQTSEVMLGRLRVWATFSTPMLWRVRDTVVIAGPEGEEGQCDERRSRKDAKPTGSAV